MSTGWPLLAKTILANSVPLNNRQVRAKHWRPGRIDEGGLGLPRDPFGDLSDLELRVDANLPADAERDAALATFPETCLDGGMRVQADRRKRKPVVSVVAATSSLRPVS
jgi:hypothetical protein